MPNFTKTMRGVLAGTALMLVATPALAGDEERARAAIAEAQGKIDAAAQVKAGEVTPDAIARARASLRLAQEELKSGHEQKAIQAAIEAQQFADTAIGRTQQRRDAEVSATVGDAQQQAVDANARAAAAEQAAAAAQADAQAARAAPPVVVAAAPAATTVTTETVKSTAPATTTVKRAPRKVVKKKTTTARPRAVTTEKTTTTVTTQ